MLFVLTCFASAKLQLFFDIRMFQYLKNVKSGKLAFVGLWLWRLLGADFPGGRGCVVSIFRFRIGPRQRPDFGSRSVRGRGGFYEKGCFVTG